MEIKTFRAKTMQQALDLVRTQLGSEATVLHTRERNSGLLRRMLLGREYEIAASGPPPAPQPIKPEPVAAAPISADEDAAVPDAEISEFEPLRNLEPPADAGLELTSIRPEQLQRHAAGPPHNQLGELQALVDQLRMAQVNVSQAELPPSLFDLFTELIDADVDEAAAREMVERLRADRQTDITSPHSVRARLAAIMEEEFVTSGPIQLSGDGARVVALVGPTGVGKTTTVAKLAANFRLREGRRVGLITVDTYRIAAVEQLRTYAEIIDLPMQVVSTPREMREAVAQMQNLDLVLIDTAGRSPRDEVRIQELRAMLGEARPHEVYLVLSAVGNARAVNAAVERFSIAGVTSLVITKLDEAAALGNLFTLARAQRLPISYVTDGQNVPDDIRVASSQELAKLILNFQNAPLHSGAA
ncbi:flagellar biosynthesis protein FlhF [Pirellulales bacterium]|nr:flagellar biosynthesis protein FlhF [Pirellulales bacterium]